jgi:hypothetical protein
VIEHCWRDGHRSEAEASALKAALSPSVRGIPEKTTVASPHGTHGTTDLSALTIVRKFGATVNFMHQVVVLTFRAALSHTAFAAE